MIYFCLWNSCVQGYQRKKLLCKEIYSVSIDKKNQINEIKQLWISSTIFFFYISLLYFISYISLLYFLLFLFTISLLYFSHIYFLYFSHISLLYFLLFLFYIASFLFYISLLYFLHELCPLLPLFLCVSAKIICKQSNKKRNDNIIKTNLDLA